MNSRQGNQSNEYIQSQKHWTRFHRSIPTVIGKRYGKQNFPVVKYCEETRKKNVEFISKLKNHIESKQMTFRLMKTIDCGNENMRKSRKEREHINYLWEVHDEVQHLS